jgi:hypothetical protein
VVGAVEGRLAYQQLVQDRADGPQVSLVCSRSKCESSSQVAVRGRVRLILRKASREGAERQKGACTVAGIIEGLMVNAAMSVGQSPAVRLRTS